MGRQFPTYLHYIETEAKSKGEFIVRTVEPRFIAKVECLLPEKSGFSIQVLEWWDPYYKGDNEFNRQHAQGVFLDDVSNWYKNQIWRKKKSLVPHPLPALHKVKQQH